MAGLMNSVQGRSLNRASDADRDPADYSDRSSAAREEHASISASENVSSTDDSSDDDMDSGKDISTASSSDSSSADSSAIHTASTPDAESAVENTGGAGGGKAGRSASKKASSSAVNTTGTSAGHKGNKKTGGKVRPRRVGRPAGPARTPITVRVLAELDRALTDAVDDTGQSPQYILDDALQEWLTRHGYLDPS